MPRRRSGGVLLAVFIGGAMFYFGPILGAVIFIFFAVALSDYTNAWQLYLGAFFVLMVMYAPGGVASSIQVGPPPASAATAVSACCREPPTATIATSASHEAVQRAAARAPRLSSRSQKRPSENSAAPTMTCPRTPGGASATHGASDGA